MHSVVDFFKIIFVTFAVLLAFYAMVSFRFKALYKYYKSKDLGDGGIQTLFGSEQNSGARTDWSRRDLR